MQEGNTKRGNSMITYLFPEGTSGTQDIDNEDIMQKELRELVRSWLRRGYIKMYELADDDQIAEKVKDRG